MIQRARRLRQNEILRKMVRETRMDKSSLVYPMFVREYSRGNPVYGGTVPL